MVPHLGRGAASAALSRLGGGLQLDGVGLGGLHVEPQLVVRLGDVLELLRGRVDLLLDPARGRCRVGGRSLDATDRGDRRQRDHERPEPGTGVWHGQGAFLPLGRLPGRRDRRAGREALSADADSPVLPGVPRFAAPVAGSRGRQGRCRRDVNRRRWPAPPEGVAADRTNRINLSTRRKARGGAVSTNSAAAPIIPITGCSI